MRRLRILLIFLFGGFGGMAMMQIANVVAGMINPPHPSSYLALCSAVVTGSLAITVVLAEWYPRG